MYILALYALLPPSYNVKRGYGWTDVFLFRLAMACKFFGGLTNVSRLATAY